MKSDQSNPIGENRVYKENLNSTFITSYERDNETDLDFAQARYNNSSIGRFTSPDPLHASANAGRPQSWNRYLYVENNPINFSDPSGLKTCFDAECSGFDDGERQISAGEIRYDSILNNGYDPEFNRFVGEVTINYTTGISGSGLAGGSIILQQPSLDEFLDAYSGVAASITNAQTKELNDARRSQALAGIQSSGLNSYISFIEPTNTEGFRFTARNTLSFQTFLSSNFIPKGGGSLGGLHFDDVNCEKGDTCKDYRSPRNSLGISGSLQIVYNSTQGRGYVDVDRFNPYQGVGGFLQHTFLEVLAPKVPGVSQVNFNGRSQSDLIDRLSRVRANYNGGR